MKKSKQAYYDKYFEKNWNNIKNTWKEIKSLISRKTVASNILTVLSLDNVDTVTNPYDIANTFNNYFASIAETTKKKKNSHKHFSDYLSNENSSTIFLQLLFFLIGIHSMQGWTTTTRHGVTRKESTKRLKHTGNLFRKNLQLKDIC